ncbi:MAG: oligopeptide transporter ATP-binding protein [Thermomicrobiales bacterium]|nr:oligopeptide transporter ATP-binding protein [Thermomicrobiales bacterium]
MSARVVKAAEPLDPLPAVPRGGTAVPPLLRVEDLRVAFFTPAGPIRVLEGVTLAVDEGEILGIVGESGSGKSVTALSIVRLLGRPGQVTGGRVLFRGHDLLTLSPGTLRGIRGEEISMIFQNPRSSLNPVVRVGTVLGEVLRVHGGLRGTAARQRAMQLLTDVGLPAPEAILRRYPHQLSGGMAQRVMIALALASSPSLLIADEPTTVRSGRRDVCRNDCRGRTDGGDLR